MYAVGRLSSYISQGVYTVSAPFHPFGGAVDIIVVEQPDGSFKSSPWYVRFGKFQGVLKTREKIVNVTINGNQVDFHMYLDHTGEAYFLREEDAEEIDSTIFSPPSSSSSGDEIDPAHSCNGARVKHPNLDTPANADSANLMVTADSRQSGMFGLLFGRKSIKKNSNKQEEGGHPTALGRVTSLESAQIAADLLDVKWSTNLSTPRRNKLSAPQLPLEEPDKVDQVNGDQCSGRIWPSDTMEIHSNHFFVEESCPCNGEIGDISNSGIADTECSSVVDSPSRDIQCEEFDEDTSRPVTSVSVEKFELLSETPTKTDKRDLETAIVEDREESELVTGVHFMPDSCTDNIKGLSQERVNSFGAGFTNKKSENLFIPEVPECATLADEVNSNDLKLPSDEDSGKHLNSNLAAQSIESSFLDDTRNLVMESQFSFDVPVVTADSGEAEILEVNHKQIISETLDEGMTGQRELVEACENHSQLNGFSNHSSGESSTKESLEEPSTEAESHAQTTEDDLVHLVEEAESKGVSISSSQSQSAPLDHEEGYLGKYNEVKNLHNESDIVNDPLRSSTEHISTKTDLSNSLSESSEDDQFLFGDVDDFVTNGVQCEDSAFPDPLEIENDLLVTMSGVEDMNGSGDMDDKSPMEESTTKSSPMSIPRSRACADDEVEWTIESLPNLRSYIENLEISETLHPLSHSLDSHSEKLREELLRKDVSCSLACDLDLGDQLADTDPTIKDKRIWEEFKNLSTSSTVEVSLCKHMLYEGMGADAASQAFDAERVDLEKCASMGPQILKNDNLIVRIGGRYFPWDAAASYIAEMLSLGHDQSFEPQGMIAVDRVDKTIDGETPRSSVPTGGSWIIWPFSRRRSRVMTSVQASPDGSDSLNTLEIFDNATVNKGWSIVKDDAKTNENSSIVKEDANTNENSSIVKEDAKTNENSFIVKDDATMNKNSPIVKDDATTNKNSPMVKVTKTKVKSIVPTSEQLATLHLKEGRNVIAFTFSTAMLGKQQVDASIYLWKWNTRIVVSDVDGTITRSDVLGQFMPLVGKDWSHIGVTHLFSAIKENGYQLLFLSARAISQAYLTRQFLFNLKQDGKALPEGPVVISPDGLFPSLFREVIRRAPHEFKIACLQDIRALFPPDCSPFYAGFGNRITDEISYRKLGIPKGKIFIINPKGEVAVNRRFARMSYTSLHALVDGMFPARTSVEQEDFNSWNYWKVPLPDINS